MKAEVIYRILRAQIEGGRIAVGDRLPSEESLAREHQVARGTVRVALQRLAEEGYIDTGQGRQRTVRRREPLQLEKLRIASTHYSDALPTLIHLAHDAVPGDRTPSFGEYLSQVGFNPTDLVLRTPTRVRCSDLVEELRLMARRVRAELNLTLASTIIWFQRVRMANGEPIALQWTVVPAQIFPEVPHEYLQPGGVTQFYEEHGVRRARARSEYGPTRATKLEAGYLGIAVGAPLIEERRVSYHRDAEKTDDVPYEYLVSLYTERATLTFDWRDQPPGPVGGRGGAAPRPPQ